MSVASVLTSLPIVVRAIEAGAADDLIAAYRSGQMEAPAFCDACADLAESLTGVPWAKFRGDVALAVYRWPQRKSYPEFVETGGFEKWFSDQVTWTAARGK